LDIDGLLTIQFEGTCTRLSTFITVRDTGYCGIRDSNCPKIFGNFISLTCTLYRQPIKVESFFALGVCIEDATPRHHVRNTTN